MNPIHYTQDHSIDRSQTEYEASLQFANTAEKSLSEAREKLEESHIVSQRKAAWDNIMAHAPILIFTIFFLIVAVVEYLISRDLYRDILPISPIFMAIAFFAVGIMVSDLLSYFINQAMRNWLWHEKERDPLFREKVKDVKGAIFSKEVRNSFYTGLVFGIILLIVIASLSVLRVNREFQAGIRTNPGFVIKDIMPVFLYGVELYLGIFIAYIIRRIRLGIRVSRLRKKFNYLVKKTNSNIQECIHKFNDSEKEHFYYAHELVNEPIHSLFWRNHTLPMNDMEMYVSETPEPVHLPIRFKIISKTFENATLMLTLYTDYKFKTTHTFIVDTEFEIQLSSYPKDSIEKIILYDFQQNILKEFSGAEFTMENTEVHILEI
jgi:hypothetical protein